jgi:hypothetical protein
MTALLMIVLVGFAGMVIDVGRVYVAQRQLQNAVDATALSIAQNMPDDYAGYNTYPSYDGVSPSKNALLGYKVTAEVPTITFICSSDAPGYEPGANPPTTATCPADVSTQDAETLCQPGDSLPPTPAGVGCNAVTVSEKATVQTTLVGAFAALLHYSFPQFTLSASATASAPQTAQPKELNVEVILDTTPSMGPLGGPCMSTVTGIDLPHVPYGIDCAKAGVRALLAGLAPCDGPCAGDNPNQNGELGANVSNPLDEVGLMTYPALANVADRTDELNCTEDLGHNPMKPDVEYPTPYPPPNQPQLGYDIVGLSSDYRTSDDPTAPLNPDSDLVKSVWWSQCPPGTPNGVYPGGDYYGLEDTGQQTTYLAGAIAEAQYQLTQNARPNTTNVIIVLSDGQLNHVNFANNGNDDTPCASAQAAAEAAKQQDTLIYSIAYDSHMNCTDTSGAFQQQPGLSLMRAIASPNTTTDTYFFDQPQGGDLTTIFGQIAQELAIKTRLIS